MSSVLLFFAINFIVSFVSDNYLNILSRQSFSSRIIQSLRVYFEQHNFVVSGIYAGLTVLSALITCSLLSFFLFSFKYPNSMQELFMYTLLAIPVGYLFDILIYKYKVFDKLDPYYKAAGAGFWGMLSFVFSILISYFIMKEVLPLLLPPLK
jgi:hypothetical protein